MRSAPHPYALQGSTTSLMLIALSVTSALLSGCQAPPLAPFQFDFAVEYVPRYPDLGPPEEDLAVWRDMAPTLMDEGVIEDAAPPEELLPTVNWIDLSLTPAKSVYLSFEQPLVVAEAFDLYGESISSELIQLEVTPSDLATLERGADGQLSIRFLREGEGVLNACLGEDFTDQVIGETLCVRRPFVIDDATPSINVTWPPRGAFLTAQDLWPPSDQMDAMTGGAEPEMEPPEPIGAWIYVEGEVTDGQRDLIVQVNGTPVELIEGKFSTKIPAHFGYNRIEITADDQAYLALSQDLRWVLWSPEIQPFEADRSVIERGLQLKIDQSFLDDDREVDLSVNPIVAQGLAQILTFFVDLIDPLTLLPTTVLSQSNTFSLSVEEFSLGSSDIDLQFTNEGISIFISLDEVILETTGQIDLIGEQVSLDGSINLGVSAYSMLTLETTPTQPLSLSVIDSGVSITSIDSDFEEASAEALIEALDTQARALITDLIDEVLADVISSQLPPLMEQSINSLFDTIREVPLYLNTGIDGVEALVLAFRVSPLDVDLNPRTSAGLWSNVEIVHEDEVRGPGTEVRGYPSLNESPDPPPSDADLTLHLQRDVLNALLSEVWRGGLLNLTPPLPPEAMVLLRTASVHALSPPVLARGAPADLFPLYLELGGLKVSLSGQLAPEIDEYEVFARIGARLTIIGGQLSIELEDVPNVTVALAHIRNTRPVLSESLLISFVNASIWPSIRENLMNNIRFGLASVSLSARDFNSLGIDLSRGQVTPQFSPVVKLLEGWVSMEGVIEASLTLAR
jgi:hypothetical protein